MHNNHTPEAIMRAALLAIAMFFAFSTVATAAGAPWYWWKSKVDGKRYCLQTTPGEGWAQDGGPYKDSK
jgi:hypothetical protein